MIKGRENLIRGFQCSRWHSGSSYFHCPEKYKVEYYSREMGKVLTDVTKVSHMHIILFYNYKFNKNL